MRFCSFRRHFDRHFFLTTKHPYFVFQLCVWPTAKSSQFLDSIITYDAGSISFTEKTKLWVWPSAKSILQFSFIFKFLSILLDYLTTWSSLTLFCSPFFPLFIQMDSKHLMVGNDISSQWNLVGLGLSGFTIPYPFLATRDSCLWWWNTWISLSQ